MRANVEFNNIEMKVEFKKSKRLIDLKMLSAKAQVLIVLSQNKNHVFSLECSLDQQSDLVMTFEKNQVTFIKKLIKNLNQFLISKEYRC